MTAVTAASFVLSTGIVQTDNADQDWNMSAIVSFLVDLLGYALSMLQSMMQSHPRSPFMTAMAMIFKRVAQTVMIMLTKVRIAMVRKPELTPTPAVELYDCSFRIGWINSTVR